MNSKALFTSNKIALHTLATILLVVTIATILYPFSTAIALTPAEQRQAPEAVGPTGGSGSTPPIIGGLVASYGSALWSCSPWGLIISGTYECFQRMFAITADILLWLASWLVYFAGAILDAAIASSIGLTNADFVQEVWTFVRDIANLLLILIFLIIGFATVLQVENFGAKKALPKAIIIAIIINFSLVLTGFLIDFTNVLTTFSLDIIRQSGGGQVRNVSNMLVTALSITRIYEDTAFNLNAGSAMLVLGTSLVGGVAVLLVTSIVFLAAAFFLIMRVVYLWFLMILSPGAFLMAILPATNE